MAINTSTAPLILSLLLTLSLAATAAHHAAAPPPADCSTVILNLADCLSYVMDGSTVSKPEGKCCSGLKTVLKSNPECLCEGFKNSAQLGVTLNVTKALDLPSACHVSAPSVSNCGLSLVPGASPAIAPIGAVSPSSIASPPTTSVVGANELAPAPAPGTTSDSTGLAISVGSLLVALLVSMLFLFEQLFAVFGGGRGVEWRDFWDVLFLDLVIAVVYKVLYCIRFLWRANVILIL